MTFPANYPGAIVVEAAQYGYSTKNHPKGFVYHTPEEVADDDPQTPRYLAGTTRQASYTYFVSYLGFVFQLVPESEGAYANGIVDKGYPSWANSAVNLNLQGISVSFEGQAANVHQTMLRGRPQWTAGVALVAHRAEALSINPDNWTRHKDVYTQRSDTGSLDIAAFTRDVKAKMEGDDMPLVNEGGRIYALGAMGKRHIGPGEYAGWRAMGFTAKKVSKADLAKLPDWDDKVAATRFKPTGHPGAALKTWIGSYDTHRKTPTGRQNHTVVKKHMDNATKDHGIRAIARPKGTPNAGQLELLVGSVRFHLHNLHTWNVMRQKLNMATGPIERIPLADPIWKLPLVKATNMKEMLALASGGTPHPHKPAKHTHPGGETGENA